MTLNPKSETLNSKQIQNPNSPNSKQRGFGFLVLPALAWYFGRIGKFWFI